MSNLFVRKSLRVMDQRLLSLERGFLESKGFIEKRRLLLVRQPLYKPQDPLPVLFAGGGNSGIVKAELASLRMNRGLARPEKLRKTHHIGVQ